MRYFPSLSMYSGLACFLLVAAPPLTSGAAVNTNLLYTTKIHEPPTSKQLPTQAPEVKRQDSDPSTFTITYTVDHTTIIIIDPSATSNSPSVDESSTVSGTGAGSESSSTNVSPELEGADATTPTTNSHPHATTVDAQNPIPTTATDSPEITSLLQSSSSSQSSDTNQQEPAHTSRQPVTDHDSDSSITIVPPQPSNPTPSDSVPDTATTQSTESDTSETISATRIAGSPS